STDRNPALAEAHARLSSATALAALGDDARAREELAQAPAVDDPDLLADLERLRGRLAMRAGDELGAVAAFERGYFAALRSDRDGLAVLAAAELAAAGAVGYRERWQWAQHAKAALARTDDHEAAAAYDRGMCTLQRDSGALDEAADHCARALAEGGDVEQRILAMKSLADVHTAADRLADARDLYAEALALGEASWAADHPGIADALDDLAHAELRLERAARARELAERALALRSDDDPSLARSLHVMAAIDRWDGRYREAYDASARALALRRAALGERHREVARSWYQLALVEEDLGRFADALRSMSTCSAIEEELHPLDIARLPTLRELARMAYTFGAGPSAGLEHLERGWSIVQAAGVPLDHPLVKDLDHGYGETLLALGRGAEGVPYLERYVDDPRPSPILPHVQFVLARALWVRAADGDRARAVALVDRAIAAVGKPWRAFDIDQLEAMHAWRDEPARRDRWNEGMNWRDAPE
ncbi:MAG TPA: tetratricopeptide repeat protein, partial [Nannocystaceae bacterium]|nr:tetratricopeptide repeat protein [Nannocystaceae bacterium]